MKYVFTSLLLVASAFVATAQKDNDIVLGKIDSVYSTILNEQRKVWVYTPGAAGGFADASQRYPVVYLLDGPGHFSSVAGLIQQLSEVNGNTVLPQMIVVAIPNTDRTRDLTPTHIVSDPPMMDSNFSKNTGGGENFARFIEKELMPHIDSLYPTQPYKVLIGHSFGGLTAMNILTNHTRLFNAYVAIDPSMWYDNHRFLEATEKKLKSQDYKGVRLYLGIANTMPPGMTVEKMKKDTGSATRHIRSIFELDQFIRNGKVNGLQYASKYYPDDDHSSVPLITEYDGLRFIFDYYKLSLTMADFTDTTGAMARKYGQHYATISKEFGFTVAPPELLINSFGYQAIATKQYTNAAAYFELNIANYPRSGNVYDSYGDLFAAMKDTAKAIAQYQKALAVQENADTRRKMEEMQGKVVYALSAAELKNYTGEFEFEGISLTAMLAIKNDTLVASVPGEGDFVLVPVAPHTFSVRGMQGYTVKFTMEGDKPVGFTSTQPNGTYVAHVKK